MTGDICFAILLHGVIIIRSHVATIISQLPSVAHLAAQINFRTIT